MNVEKNSPLRDRVRIQTTKREYPINIDDFVAFWKKIDFRFL